MFEVEKETEDNPLPLCELRIDAELQDDVALRAELSLGLYEIDCSEKIFSVGLKSADLTLDLEGLKISLGTKIGSINSIQTKRTTTNTVELQHRQAAAISMMLKGITPSLSSEHSRAKNLKFASEAEHDHQGIRSLTGPRWKIENPQQTGKPIDSCVLTGEVLCRLKPVSHSNRKFITACMSALPSEISVSQKGGFRKPSTTNRERVIGLVVARALRSGQRYDPKPPRPIRLSTVEIELREATNNESP